MKFVEGHRICSCDDPKNRVTRDLLRQTCGKPPHSGDRHSCLSLLRQGISGSDDSRYFSGTFQSGIDACPTLRCPSLQPHHPMEQRVGSYLNHLVEMCVLSPQITCVMRSRRESADRGVPRIVKVRLPTQIATPCRRCRTCFVRCLSGAVSAFLQVAMEINTGYRSGMKRQEMVSHSAVRRVHRDRRCW